MVVRRLEEVKIVLTGEASTRESVLPRKFLEGSSNWNYLLTNAIRTVGPRLVLDVKV